MINIPEDIRKIRSGEKELREFALTIGAVLVLISGLALWRGKASGAYFLISGLLFIGFGAARPELLKPLQKVWMAFSAVIGFFMSRVILAILFYCVVAPIGVVMKLFGKDILDQRVSSVRPSYWRERSAAVKSKESYVNQY